MPATTSHEPIFATLIPGEGIGPEITDAVVKNVAALGARFRWDVQEGGNAALVTASTRDARTCGQTEEAARLRAAIDQTLIDDNVRTGDLGGNVTTHAITEAILQRLA
jgi:isocitrate/isopropylmalate dehydrogenase